jgi:hypothetical protein
MAHWVVTLVIALIGIASCLLRLANARAREHAGLPPPVRVKLPLHWCLVALLLVEAGAAFVFYTSRVHGSSVDGRFWFLLVVNTVAIAAMSFRLITRQSPTVDKLTRMEHRNGYSLLIGIAGAFGGACVSSLLITGQWFYPPKTSPADVRYVVGFAALCCSICVFASRKLINRGKSKVRTESPHRLSHVCFMVLWRRVDGAWMLAHPRMQGGCRGDILLPGTDA